MVLAIERDRLPAIRALPTDGAEIVTLDGGTSAALHDSDTRACIRGRVGRPDILSFVPDICPDILSFAPDISTCQAHPPELLTVWLAALTFVLTT